MSGVGQAERWRAGGAGVGLGLLAELELGVRLATGEVGRTAGGDARWSFLLVLGLLTLATTVPSGLLREPTAALIVVPALVLSFGLFQLVTVAGTVAALISGYRLGYSGSRLVVVLGLPFLALALVGTEGAMRVFAVLLASLVPTAAAVGTAQRARSQTVRNDAAHQALAGRLREHTARGERAVIARELHDVVAHHISMIAVQAETARLTVAGLPPDGARQLLGIGDTARAGLTEMRRLLGVLRTDAPAEAGGRQPQPGLGQLNELLDEAREISGAGVRLIVRGPPEPLDPGVELAAYRIVQEALTNARRHAPGAAVDVELQYTARALRLRVRDNGPGPRNGVDPEVPGRHGLPGIRERTAAVGGRIWIGPAAGGGFLIDVSLPAAADPEREA